MWIGLVVLCFSPFHTKMFAIWINKSIHGLTNSHNLHITKLFIAQSLVYTMAALLSSFMRKGDISVISERGFIALIWRALITFISPSLQNLHSIWPRTAVNVTKFIVLFIPHWQLSYIDDKTVYLISRDMRPIEHDSLHTSMHLTPFNLSDSFLLPPFFPCKSRTNSNHDLRFMIDLGLQRFENERENSSDDLLAKLSTLTCSFQ